jgi:hypothetical protein
MTRPCEVVGDRHCGRDYLWSVGGQRRDVSDGVGVGDGDVGRGLACSGHEGLRAAASAAPRKAASRSPRGQPAPVVMGQPLSG